MLPELSRLSMLRQVEAAGTSASNFCIQVFVDEPHIGKPG